MSCYVDDMRRYECYLIKANLVATFNQHRCCKVSSVKCIVRLIFVSKQFSIIGRYGKKNNRTLQNSNFRLGNFHARLMYTVVYSIGYHSIDFTRQTLCWVNSYIDYKSHFLHCYKCYKWQSIERLNSKLGQLF